MGFLDSFDLYGKKNYGKIFISITNYGMTFSKSCVVKLNYPEFVHVYFEHDGNRMAVTPCEKDSEARNFVRDKDSIRAGFVRWNDRDLIQHIISLGNMTIGKKGVRVYGEYVSSDNVLVFDLPHYTPIGKKSEEESMIE